MGPESQSSDPFVPSFHSPAMTIQNASPLRRRAAARVPVTVMLAAVCLPAFPRALAQAGQWAWMAGSSTVPTGSEGPPGIYGTLGVPTAGNVPGGRSGAASWTDSAGNFWLFQGFGIDSTGAKGALNDL